MSAELMKAIEDAAVELPYEPAPSVVSTNGKPRPAAEPAVTPPPVENKLVIILSHGDFESVTAAMILANASAAMEQETHIFCTFWGLFPLLRDDVRITGDNFMQRMLSFMNRGGLSHLKTSKFNFAGAGPAMFNVLRHKYNVASPKELVESAMDLGVKFHPCQMTMDMMGLKPEHMIDGLEPPAGAASVLMLGRGANNLFI